MRWGENLPRCLQGRSANSKQRPLPIQRYAGVILVLWHRKLKRPAACWQAGNVLYNIHNTFWRQLSIGYEEVGPNQSKNKHDKY